MISASSHIELLRFDAGSLSLNLVATVGRRFGQPVERLGSTARLREWLAGVGLAAAAALSDDDLRRVRRVREQLDALFRTSLAGGRPPADVLADVNAAAGAGVLCLHLTDVGVALAPAQAGTTAVEPVIALVVTDAMRILAGVDRNELRACEAGDCRMLFLAHGRRARRWCSSERCGNRSRVAAHRARAGSGHR